MKTRILLPLLILLGLSALICLQRLHTYHEPLERDLTLYAVIGHELLAGRSLYSDLCENKPPAIFLTYAVAEKLTGYGPKAIYTLGVIAAVITLLGVYTVGYMLSGSIGTGLWAASFWTIICSNLQLQANQPNSEVFVNAGVIWAFALMLRNDHRPWLWRFFMIGTLFAIASIYKFTVLAVVMALSGVYLMFPPGDPPARRLAFKQISVIAVIGGMAWALVFVYFAAVGHFKDFYELVFTFNRYSAGNVIKNLEFGLIYFPYFLKYAVLFIYSSCIASLLIGPGPLRRPWIFLLGLIIGTHIEAALPGKWFPHHYMYWLPIIAVTAAWTIEQLGILTQHRGVWPKYVIGLILLILMGWHEFPNYQISPQDWSWKKYGGIFVNSKLMGEDIPLILKSDETFYEWGAESNLYYYSRKSPLSGVMCYWHLFDWPYGLDLSERVVKKLEKAQPELFIIPEWLIEASIRPNPVLDWFYPRYRPFSLRKSFILFARRGGKLESRLGQDGQLRENETLARTQGNMVLNKIKAFNR